MHGTGSNDGLTAHSGPMIVPLIDVALVLVLILLVTAPLMTVADLKVDLPQARTREAEDQRNISLTIGADGRYALDEKILGEPELRLALAHRLAEPGADQVLVVVRADSGVTFARVRALIEQARADGAKRLAIATRQPMGGSS